MFGCIWQNSTAMSIITLAILIMVVAETEYDSDVHYGDDLEGKGGNGDVVRGVWLVILDVHAMLELCGWLRTHGLVGTAIAWPINVIHNISDSTYQFLEILQNYSLPFTVTDFLIAWKQTANHVGAVWRPGLCLIHPYGAARAILI